MKNTLKNIYVKTAKRRLAQILYYKITMNMIIINENTLTPGKHMIQLHIGDIVLVLSDVKLLVKIFLICTQDTSTL